MRRSELYGWEIGRLLNMFGYGVYYLAAWPCPARSLEDSPCKGGALSALRQLSLARSHYS